MSKEEIFFDVNGKGYLRISHVDKSFVPNTDKMPLEESIEYIKSLFEFVEDKTEMYKMIEEIKPKPR